MKIALVLWSPWISGGTNVIFHHALYLKRAGHDVRIVRHEPTDDGDLLWFPDAKSLRFETYESVENEEFDLAIATWWVTIFNFHRVRAQVYGYFVQSIESRFYKSDDYPARYWADSTYAFSLQFVTEATWIKRHLSELYGRDAALVRNGIDKSTFTEEGEAVSPREPGKLRVLVEGPLGVFFKNTEKALQLCIESPADEVWFLTSTNNVESYPGVSRVFSCVPIKETAAVYRSCDIVVKLSYVEGMFGPPLEMFHCGGTAIVYDVTGHDEYIRHDENGIVIKTDDEAGVIEAIAKLRRSPEMLARLKGAARETAREWPSWEESSQGFEASLVEMTRQSSDSREMIAGRARVMQGWFDRHLESGREIARRDVEIERLRLECNQLRDVIHQIYGSKGYRVMQRLRDIGILRAVVSPLHQVASLLRRAVKTVP